MVMLGVTRRLLDLPLTPTIEDGQVVVYEGMQGQILLRRDVIAFQHVVGPVSSLAVLAEQDKMLTGWAKTRCKKTCITKGGFGKTAFTICASVSTVALISVNRDVRPSSLFGGVESGSGIVRHLITWSSRGS